AFKWEIVPYQKCRFWLGRIIQQLQVLWRIVFGGVTASKKSTSEEYKSQLNKSEFKAPPYISRIEDDAFCRSETFARQKVISGKKVDVLFNYAPIGWGKEKLHFLIVPKMHRDTFMNVTEEEHTEALGLMKLLVNHYYVSKIKKTIENAYILN